MKVFIDTTALYALLDREDPAHAAAEGWLRSAREDLVTHNYVVVESVALVRRRLGLEAARDLLENLLAPVTIAFVDEELHQLATTALLAAIRRRPSLVDWVSFEFMRDQGIRQAFAFDRDFDLQGFHSVP